MPFDAFDGEDSVNPPPDLKLVAGNSNPPLARAISELLNVPLTECEVERFADKEIFVEVSENVRGQDCYILQSTSFPANDNLMELLVLIDCLKRASAKRITAVIPYFGYARQDRKPKPRTPITSKLVANLIERAGADRVLTLDLHAGQIQGFFDIPTDNLYAAPVIVRDIHNRLSTDKLTVVSPDAGGVVRARELANRLKSPIAICNKWREAPGKASIMNVIGDVEGRRCILIDDIVDSGGTLVSAAEELIKAGAIEVHAYITHGVLSGGAVAKISNSQIKTLVITDTILPTEAVRAAANVQVLSISTLLAKAILRTSREQSVSGLFGSG
ncbi:MAG: ribose-phosphate pyrophosphokinase [Alphaproteobacteria bacterium]|nr:ribose-phosphate pyrophosphokinase [Alphaproteobacteria bacterium]